MTILLYDYCELEERASRHLRAWKGWHLVLYVSAAVLGAVNYVFLQNTMQLVDNHCILFPRQLEYHMVDSYIDVDSEIITFNTTGNDNNTMNDGITENAQVINTVPKINITNVKLMKIKAVPSNEIEAEIGTVISNETVMTENATHRLVLDTSRTLFETDSRCHFAEYMPIMSTVCASMWITMFTMCPGGGRARSGLQQPWRILAPALIFALVMVGLTGRSFMTTNGGLHAFCAAFHDVTNSTTCSAVNEYLELGWNATWGMGGRIAATRAASAGVLASWACAAALLLARCIAAPDFQVKRTTVYLTKDPQKKVTPYLKKSSLPTRRSNQNSPTKRETASMKSEHTATTELVTASVEHEQDSIPTSMSATPVRIPHNQDLIEMSYTPQERKTYL